MENDLRLNGVLKLLDEFTYKQVGLHANKELLTEYSERVVKLFAMPDVMKSVCHEPTEPCQSFLNHGFAVCEKCDNFY